MSKPLSRESENAQLCLINLLYKLKSTFEHEKFNVDSNIIKSNEIYSWSAEEITSQISQLIEKYCQNYPPAVQQNNSENSLSQISKEELATEYESMIQKLELEVRSHIRLEQQLKLHLDSFQGKMEEYEKSEDNYKKTIQKLNDEIKQLKTEIKHIQSENSELKEKNESLEEKLLNYAQNKSSRRNERIIKIEENKEKIISINKMQKSETKNEESINIYKKGKKIKEISSKKSKLSRKKEDGHSIQKLFRKTTENNNKLDEVKTIRKENTLIPIKSQSIIQNRSFCDPQLISKNLLSEWKNNSENISKEMIQKNSNINRKKSTYRNSSILSKRINNGKIQPQIIYKTINNFQDSQFIQTERKRDSSKDSLKKKSNNFDKFKILKSQKTKNLSRRSNYPDSTIPINSFNMISKEEDDSPFKNDDASESIGCEANVCEKNIDNVDRRARSITYQYGATFCKFFESNSNVQESKHL